MKDMLIEYMGKGFLDNIIALFKQDDTVYRFIPDMLGAEQLQVRLGTVALVEELMAAGRRKELRAAIPGLIGLLQHANPTIRGDAASLLGTLGEGSAKEALEKCLKDEHPMVREAAREALSDIG